MNKIILEDELGKLAVEIKKNSANMGRWFKYNYFFQRLYIYDGENINTDTEADASFAKAISIPNQFVILSQETDGTYYYGHWAYYDLETKCLLTNLFSPRQLTPSTNRQFALKEKFNLIND